MIFSGALSSCRGYMVMSAAGACSNLLQSLAIMTQPSATQKRDGIVPIRVALCSVEQPVIRKNAIRFFRITRQTIGDRRCWDRRSPE